jgi:hypothetical protein
MPGYELKATSISLTLLAVPTWPIANLLSEEPTLSRLDLVDPPDMMFLLSELTVNSEDLLTKEAKMLLDTRLTQRLRLWDLCE